jgi:uncharacterized protein
MKERKMEKGSFNIGIKAGMALALAASTVSAVPKNILHYAKVGYFNHVGGIKGCTTALNTLAAQYDFKVKHSTDPNDLLNLKAYDLVIYDNNTDAGAVTNTITAPQIALMEYMNTGGKYLGFHAASDHRGQWTWYDTAMYSGAKFVSHNGGPFNIFKDTTAQSKQDPALARMWAYCKDTLKMSTDVVSFDTEIYQFNIDVKGKPNTTIFQELRGAPAKGGVRESFGWIKSFPNGGKMMYTALGHETPEWTANDSWLTKATYAYMRYLLGDFNNPVVSLAPRITVEGQRLEIGSVKDRTVRVSDIGGRLVAAGKGSQLNGFNLKEGMYFVTVKTAGKVFSKTIVIK